MGTGPQGPQGPPGPTGPQGLPIVTDSTQVADTLTSQNMFLNRLVINIANDKDLSSSISQKFVQSPATISKNLAENSDFQNMIGNYVVSNAAILAGRIADGIILNQDNTLKLTNALASQGNFISDLSKSLNDPNLPYAQFLKGPTGNIADVKTAIQPISMLCDTAGNCRTPRFEYEFKLTVPCATTSGNCTVTAPSFKSPYLNFTAGNLLMNTSRGAPAFRISSDGKPWITGFSGGQLGSYNNNTDTGTTVLTWDAQGNINAGDLSGNFDIKGDIEESVVTGDITRTTGSLRINGNGYLYNLYATGIINSKNKMGVFNTQGSSFARLFLHTGSPRSHKGGTGTTDGSSFTLIKNGPYKKDYGGPNAAVLNNFSNPYIFGDGSSSGNIYMLNNSNNLGPIMDGNWVNKTIQGNNAAIINNTGTIDGKTGSLMVIGNAAGGGGSSRVVSIKDKLQIGNWQLSQSANGSLAFTKNGGDKMTFGQNGINVPSDKINDANVRTNTINGITINNSALTATNLSIQDSVNMSQNISAGNYQGGSLQGNYMYTNTVTANGGDHSFGDIVVGRYGWGNSNGRGGIELAGDLTVRNVYNTDNSNVDINGDLTVNNSIRSQSDIVVLDAESVRATGQLYRYSDKPIKQQ